MAVPWTLGSRLAIAGRSGRGGGRSRDLDQPVALQIAEQLHDLALALLGLDLIFADQAFADLVQPSRLVEHLPHRARRAVEAVAGAVIDVQSDDLPVNFRFDQPFLAA